MKDKLIGLVMLAVFVAVVLWVCATFKYGSAYLVASLLVTLLVCVVAAMAKRDIRHE